MQSLRDMTGCFVTTSPSSQSRLLTALSCISGHVHPMQKKVGVCVSKCKGVKCKSSQRCSLNKKGRPVCGRPKKHALML